MNCFQEQFLFFKTKNIKNTFGNKKTVLFFFFLRIENKLILENIFLVIFICFFDDFFKK